MGPFYEDIDVFAPLVPNPDTNASNVGPGIMKALIVARVKPGVTFEQARSETEVLSQQIKNPGDPSDRSGHLVVQDFAEMFRNAGPTMLNARSGLWMTLVASGLVLLVACANVASLLLARGVKRHREVAVRAALGCSPGRMIRQLLTESTLLFVCGGSLGFVVAEWSAEIITKAASGILGHGTYVKIDARVLAASIGVSLVTALFFGCIPAFHTARVNLNDSLKGVSLKLPSGGKSRQPRNLLVAFQISLGMVLLVGFGLLLRSLWRVESSPLGYEPRNVLTATVVLPASHYSDTVCRARLVTDALDRVRLMPEVDSVGITDSLPMFGADSARLRIERSAQQSTLVDEEIWFLSVSPEYFSTLKVAMQAGRSFQASDKLGSLSVAIVNGAFARQYFPGASPIGHHVAFADSPNLGRQIVGVVSDFRQRNPEEDLRALVYFPVAQTVPARRLSMAVRLRASSDFAGTAKRLSERLRPLDPQLYWETGNMEQQIHDSESLSLRRPVVTMLAAFGGLALILSLVGVFGVTSYSVAERTRELGIRIALGASRPEVARLVLWETLLITATGLAVGACAALALTQFLPSDSIGWSGSGIYLYGISRTDWLTYVSAALLLMAVGLAASYIPARRAMRVDPMVALRYE